jgi:radical SAM protein with 4Fe4S-binding SPASM domain
MDKDTPYCKRAKLDTGTECNLNCWFCYYKSKLNDKVSLDTIKDRVDYLVSCGIEEVDLSGGESSIHEDWFEILDYCKSRGMKISALSNGVKFADMDFLKKSQQHGLEEILFSLHGYDEMSHGKMVGGDSFNDIVKAIKNAHKLGIIVRINCVVSEVNYINLPDIYPELIKTLYPYEVNFLTLNYWSRAKNIEPFSYELSTNTIKRCIDSMQQVPIINVRYTPYCYMVGYESYVCNIYQHIHDRYDWNMAVYNGDISPDEYNHDPLTSLYNTAKKHRMESYHKPDGCKTCKYFYICDGLENGVNEKVNPVEGKSILDVNYYRKGYYED